MKKYVAILAAVCLAFGVSACGSSSSSSASGSEAASASASASGSASASASASGEATTDESERTTFTVGFDAEYPPYGYMDDNGDYRPGLQAVAELQVKSPLRHVGLTKQEIRDYSHQLGLPTWDKQSFACLSSRFVYGEEITAQKLGMVDKAEQLLLDLGFHQLRVRIHGTIARIEVLPAEFEKLLQNREQIVVEFKKYGFTYVTMDLQGYRMGSMNETLNLKG